MGIKVKTGKFRAAFVNVFKPKPGHAREDGTVGEPSYTTLALFQKGEDMTVYKDAIIGAIMEKQKCDRETALNIVKHPKFKNPIKDQAEMVDKESRPYAGMEAGAYCINFASKIRPGLVDENREDLLDQSEFFSGCFARASVEAFFFDHKVGGRGVSFELHNLQRMAMGESLGGSGVRAKAQDDFEPVELPQGEKTASSLFD